MHGFLAQTAPSLSADIWQTLAWDRALILWVLGVHLAFILATWIVSRVLVPRYELNSFAQFDRREGGGLGKSFLLYFAYLLGAILVLGGLKLASIGFKAVFLTALAAPTTLPVKSIALIVTLALLGMLFGLLLPMLIFRIRLGRAIALLVLVKLIVTGAAWGLDRVLDRPVEKRWAAIQGWAAERKQAGAGLLDSLAAQAQREAAFTAAEKIASDKEKAIDERKNAVTSMFNQLEEIRGKLEDGDVEGAVEYNRKKARYEVLLREVQAAAAQSQ